MSDGVITPAGSGQLAEVAPLYADLRRCQAGCRQIFLQQVATCSSYREQQHRRLLFDRCVSRVPRAQIDENLAEIALTLPGAAIRSERLGIFIWLWLRLEVFLTLL